MLFFKFEFLIWTLVLFFPFMSARPSFTDTDCVRANFTTRVSHKGFPLGLTQNILKVDKNNCLITIEHEKMKFLKKKWFIDVCREPVHIKVGTGQVEVVKRELSLCEPHEKKDKFCSLLKEMELIFQDDGLIFAEGERDDLTTDHGHVYCAYLLVTAYLRQEIIFSRDGNYQDILPRKERQSVRLPVPEASEFATPATASSSF